MMIDIGTLLWWLGLFVFGIVVGRAGKKAKAKKSSASQPLCGCEHGLHAHDPKTGICHERVSLNALNEKTKWGDCKCRQYTGPRPLDQLWMPEVLPPSSSD